MVTVTGNAAGESPGGDAAPAWTGTLDRPSPSTHITSVSPTWAGFDGVTSDPSA